MIILSDALSHNETGTVCDQRLGLFVSPVASSLQVNSKTIGEAPSTATNGSVSLISQLPSSDALNPNALQSVSPKVFDVVYRHLRDYGGFNWELSLILAFFHSKPTAAPWRR